MNQYQHMAMHALHLPFNQAIQITNNHQYMAMFVLHLSFEQAVQITNNHQLAAMRILNFTFEDAIQIEEESQLQTLIRLSYLPNFNEHHAQNETIIPQQQPGVPPIAYHIIDFLSMDILNS